VLGGPWLGDASAPAYAENVQYAHNAIVPALE
jgi:hypothetical protein